MTLSMVTLAAAQELTLGKKHTGYNETDYSPFVDQHQSNQAIWGDTHRHTPQLGHALDAVGLCFGDYSLEGEQL